MKTGERYLVVRREPGPAWDPSRDLREQDGWDEHAAFMDALAAEGFIVAGGPIGEYGAAVHVVDAASEVEVASRLAADPWTSMGVLRLAAVEAWTILLARP